jgi:hypothetical protein
MTLTDRYVDAVVRHVPADQRAEVAADVRALIADATEARIASGDAPADATALETEVLQGLGRPARLAADYAEGPSHLIGPAYYFTWKRLTTLLVVIVAPIIAALTAVGGWLDGDGVWAILGSTIGAAFTVTMGIGFWVTLIFAIMERQGVALDDDDDWTVADLPERQSSTVKLGESIGEIAMLIFVGGLLVWQAREGVLSGIDGLTEPLLAPTLPTYVLPAILFVIAAEVLSIIVRQVRGHWTMLDWGFTIVLNVATIAILVPIFASGGFLNPAAFAELGWPDADSTITLLQLQQGVAAIIVIFAVIDVVSSYRKVRAPRA